MIRALVVDDEEPARVRLRAMLAEHEDVEIAGEADNGEQAMACVAALCPDLVFLDVQMPGLDGLHVAAALPPPRPRIVFCTAYDQYAVEAFEQHALDYLLKPLNGVRLARSLERVRHELGGGARLEREAAAATATQARLFPQSGPCLAHLDYAGVCRPAHEVGGDYYDFLPLGEGRVGLCIGDVSGKGLFAGLLVASLQARVQTLAPRYGSDLEALLIELNRRVYESTDSNRYATFFFTMFDDATRELHWINAGHVPGLLWRADRREIERLAPSGTAVGLLREATFRQETTRLSAGDVLVLCSDGVSEAASPDGEEFGLERLAALIHGAPELGARALRERILDELIRFRAGAVAEDDLTVVVARVS